MSVEAAVRTGAVLVEVDEGWIFLVAAIVFVEIGCVFVGLSRASVISGCDGVIGFPVSAAG